MATWVERSDDGYMNRGKGMSLSNLWHPYYLDFIQSIQAHHSMYAFDQKPLTQFLRNERALNSKYPGEYSLPVVILDIDGKEIQRTTEEARSLLFYLFNTLGVKEEHIHIFFSGSKGYHIYLNTGLFGFEPSPNLPRLVKGTLLSLFKYDFVDISPYSPAGLIRSPFSLHMGSGRTKEYVPLDAFFESDPWKWTMDIERPVEEKQEILKTIYEAPPAEPILAEYQKYERAQEDRKRKTISFGKFDPSTMVTCMQHLYARGPVEGRRHQDLLRLSSWLYRGGVPEDAASEMLSRWIPESFNEVKGVVSSTYTSGYSYSCSDKVMSEFCDDRCVFNRKKDFSMEVQSSEGLGVSLARYAQMIQDGMGFDIYELFQIETDKTYRIVPCETVLVIADTGMGKSLLIQDMLRRIGKRCLFVNLEMPEHLVARRFLQTQHNITKGETIKKLLKQEDGFVDSINYINLISDSSTIEQVERATQQIRPEIVVIDTTDGISVPDAGNNEMWHLKKVVEGMRHIANRYQTIVIGIHHISKSASRDISGENKRFKRSLTLNDATGNRAAVTKSDHVLGLEGVRTSSVRNLKSLKARDEEPLDVMLNMKWEKQRVYHYDSAHMSEQLDLLVSDS